MVHHRSSDEAKRSEIKVHQLPFPDIVDDDDKHKIPYFKAEESIRLPIQSMPINHSIEHNTFIMEIDQNLPNPPPRSGFSHFKQKYFFSTVVYNILYAVFIGYKDCVQYVLFLIAK